MRTDFLNQALAIVKVPEILVNLVSRRVRQLGLGYRPLVPVNPQWSLKDVALKEIADEKLSYELVRNIEDGRGRNVKAGKKGRGRA